MLAEAAQPAPAMPAAIPGFMAAMDASGPWVPVPILMTATEPGGPAEQSFVDETLARMRTLLAAAGPLDSIYVCNHGAMTATADTATSGGVVMTWTKAPHPLPEGEGTWVMAEKYI